MIDRLKEALTHAESTANGMQIDEIAWLIGSFPTQDWTAYGLEFSGYAKISALLPEMTPCSSKFEALLRVGQWMNREDIVGTVAERIRKVMRP